jgi:hypothetical protein
MGAVQVIWQRTGSLLFPPHLEVVRSFLRVQGQTEWSDLHEWDTLGRTGNGWVAGTGPKITSQLRRFPSALKSRTITGDALIH